MARRPPADPKKKVSRPQVVRIPEDRPQLCLRLRIRFGVGGNASTFSGYGWSFPEDHFTWSVGPHSSIHLPPVSTQGDCVLTIYGTPFLHDPELREQRLRFELGGVELLSITANEQSSFVIEVGRALSSRPGSTTLEIYYPDATAPSTFGADDTRKLAFAWRSIEVSEYVKGVDLNLASSPEVTDPVSRRLRAWAVHEMSSWLTSRVDADYMRRTYEYLNATTHWSAVFSFHHNTVEFVPKPSPAARDRVSFDRAQDYLRFFKSVARRLSPDFSTTICLGVADLVLGSYDVPILAFQRLFGEQTALVPDVELIQNDFYENSVYEDIRSYLEKTPTAVFAGATTGGIITRETAQTLSLPRLEAAGHFEQSLRVDFRLPRIVQCADSEVEGILKARSFCCRPRLSWNDQLRHRLILSMDGNGAACSRVAIGLRSNSALVKYESPYLLYYFGGLTKWEHYIPVKTNADVEDVLAMELQYPGQIEAIANRGRSFASEYLSRDRAEEYTAFLIGLFGQVISE